MEEWQRQCLRKSREKMVKSMTDVENIVTVLGSRGILTDSMEDTIMVEATKQGKIRELMKMLPKRGERAFDIFYDVLVSEDEGPCADIIKPELKNRRLDGQNHQFSPSEGACYTTTEIKDLPSVFPDKNDDMTDINVKTCIRADGNFMFENFKKITHIPYNGVIYSLKKPIRGLCVLINNANFSMAPGFDDRLGTQKDFDALTTLFDQLNFTVKPHHNKTAQEMREILQKLKDNKDLDHSNFDCFVFIVLSHGKNGSVCGVDGNTVQIDEIITSFDGTNCKSLVGKPKLFFIQACQGNKIDNGIPVVDEKEVIEITKILNNLNIHAQKESTDSRTNNMVMTSDMYIAMATMPGYVSWRHVDMGTWFIQAIVYAFKNYSHQCNLNSLMTKVNALVQSAETSEGQNKQTSVATSSLNKELYFFPGLTEQTYPRMNQVQTYPRMNQVQPSDAAMQH